jgi:D-sedoheptulose 7-phosphate isomerase
MLDLNPGLIACQDALMAAFEAIVAAMGNDGCLYICGNGGSMSDALHISGELLKSYTLPRPLGADIKAKLRNAGPDGELLGQALQCGLRTTVLGLNHSLSSALENDISIPSISYAQELLVMGRADDILLGISTSGNARNVCYAAQVARALGMPVLSLTGQAGGKLATLADVAIRAPANRTDRIQELHVYLYHCLCEMLETHFFGSSQ